MKLVIYQENGPALEIEARRIDVTCGSDRYDMREQTAHGRDGSSLLISLEEHAGELAQELAVFPTRGNVVRLKGGLR